MSCFNSSGKSISSDDLDLYTKAEVKSRDKLLMELKTKFETRSHECLKSLPDDIVLPIKKCESLRVIRHSPVAKTKVKKSESFLHMMTRRSKNGTIFGSDMFTNDMNSSYQNVPKILVECCHLIEEKIRTEDEAQGIYRIPGEYSKIQKIGERIYKGDYQYLETISCINILAGVVKLFLRETKTPLISSEEIQQFAGLNQEEWCKSSTKERTTNLRKFYEALDTMRKDTLEFILKHLKRLCDRYPKQVNSENFAITIGPAIIHINNENCLNVLDTLTEHDTLNEYLRFMIDNCSDLFRDTTDIGNEVEMVTSL